MVADHSGWIADRRVWVLTEDTAILGVLVLFPEPEHLLLYSIAVQPSAQGRGHGRRLMSFVERQARERSLRRVVLYTNEAMTENIAFYERLGYERFDRRRHPTRAGSWLVHMRKAVEAGGA